MFKIFKYLLFSLLGFLAFLCLVFTVIYIVNSLVKNKITITNNTDKDIISIKVLLCEKNHNFENLKIKQMIKIETDCKNSPSSVEILFDDSSKFSSRSLIYIMNPISNRGFYYNISLEYRNNELSARQIRRE